jgi:hypothetical protein
MLLPFILGFLNIFFLEYSREIEATEFRARGAV